MGCVAHVMDGQARLEVLHGIFHPDGEPFRFDWDWLAPSGLSTKDFVAPSSLCFGTAKTFGLGGKYGAVSFLQILAPELSDEMLADFLKTESGILGVSVPNLSWRISMQTDGWIWLSMVNRATAADSVTGFITKTKKESSPWTPPTPSFP